ncbi:fibroblast growth factor 13 isoform X1 [Hydra vulgaris]|uniref:fibroblast growth factor 13 isoform X1 n=2 Tax=Hydra vulgaris TaxID=6087 RepID=UPI000640DCB3|nr:fibroblast growth factor 13 isoform X1 [Hydra vulgaris]
MSCGCLKHTWNKMFASVVLSLLLFAKMFETKSNFSYDNTNKTSFEVVDGIARHEIHILIKKITKSADEITIDRFARQNDRNVADSIRKRKKRRHNIVLHKPTNWRHVWLKSRTGYFLQIEADGTVNGHINKTNYTKMELQVITPQIKRIVGVATGRFLAINKKGKVESKVISDQDTYFHEEMLETLDFSFSSIKYPKEIDNPPWYLGLKRKQGSTVKGRAKRASRTLQGDKATHFSITYADT